MNSGRIGWIAVTAGCMSLMAAACGQAVPLATPSPTPPAEIILYSWAEYMPPEVLEAFAQETGIQVRYEVYDDQSDAAQEIRQGLAYDLVVLDREYLPTLIEGGFLAELDYRNLPNARNISVNFRDLTFDPSSLHSIPFHWGITGILVRSDRVSKPVTRWRDLWDPDFAGRVAVWPIRHSLIPIALVADGHSVDSMEAQDLSDAAVRLRWLRDHALILSNKEESVVPRLLAGEAVVAYGWAYDADRAAAEEEPIDFVIPEEGTILWQDLFVIPAASPHPHAAELFLDFILRPDVSARIIEVSRYAMANDAALELLDPATLANPLIFPSDETLRRAIVHAPLGPEAEALWDQLWAATLEPMEGG